MAYKLTMKRLHAFRPPSPSCPHLGGKIVEQLFPSQEPIDTNGGENMDATFDPVIQEEIHSAARPIKPGKAPGPDGLPSIVIKMAMEPSPALLEEAEPCPHF
ncbi:hypothetical protein ACLKA6_000849 [Drosophila palustris]